MEMKRVSVVVWYIHGFYGGNNYSTKEKKGFCNIELWCIIIRVQYNIQYACVLKNLNASSPSELVPECTSRFAEYVFYYRMYALKVNPRT